MGRKNKENIMLETTDAMVRRVKREKANTKFERIIVVGFGNVTNNVVRVHTKDDVYLVLESTMRTYDSHRKMGLSMEEERELLVEYYYKDYGNNVTLNHKVIVNMKLLPNKQSKASWGKPRKAS